MLAPPKSSAVCTIEHAGSDAIVRLSGDVNSLYAEELGCILADLVHGGVERLMLDFDAVELIDASGLRTLVSTANQLGNAGGRHVRVIRPSDRVRSVFDATGLTHFFHIDHGHSWDASHA